MELIIDRTEEAVWSAVREEKQIVEVDMRRAGALAAGTIVDGVVTELMPSMNAAFVHVGRSKAGLLHLEDLAAFRADASIKEGAKIQDWLRPGECVRVQVRREEVESKGPKLSTILKFNGRGIVYIANSEEIGVSKRLASESGRAAWRETLKTWAAPGEGFILRTEAAAMTETEVKKEADRLRKTAAYVHEDARADAPAVVSPSASFLEQKLTDTAVSLLNRVIVNHPADAAAAEDFLSRFGARNVTVEMINQGSTFAAENVCAELKHVFTPKVPLAGGGSIMIECTEALTAIDVNMGGFKKENSRKQAIQKANETAILEIARQLRLRDIGGLIVIDLIDMADEVDKENVLQLLKKKLQDDRKKTNVGGITQFGLVELTRKRTGSSWLEEAKQLCSLCNGEGNIIKESIIPGFKFTD
ncbi:RNAse G [Salsuginibacillus halophilus]|uniref:RNAse G n=1 Tax=Salsuginibacillus halophilus TaxID=517424 RepID=A0A2P8HCK3_9BACI|nr:ribonuclease E/G [Salsuginibacillus halophilus]PSL43960.1 RNAse G [Salsuginibacillus halophilus]